MNHDILSQPTLDDYLALLPDATAVLVRNGFSTNTDPNVLIFEIIAQPSAGLSTRGSGLWPKETLQRIGAEIRLAICTDDPKYAEFREKLAGEAKVTAAVIVNLLSNAVAVYVDVMTAMCVPLVALVLAAISKMGKAGWCAATTEKNLSPPSEIGEQKGP